MHVVVSNAISPHSKQHIKWCVHINIAQGFIRRDRKIAKRRLIASSCLSVRLSAWNNSAPLNGFSQN